jgi:hypothetical protein
MWGEEEEPGGNGEALWKKDERVKCLALFLHHLPTQQSGWRQVKRHIPYHWWASDLPVFTNEP